MLFFLPKMPSTEVSSGCLAEWSFQIIPHIDQNPFSKQISKEKFHSQLGAHKKVDIYIYAQTRLLFTINFPQKARELFSFRHLWNETWLNKTYIWGGYLSKMAFSAFQLPSLPSGLSGGHLVGAPWAPPAEVLKSRLDLGGVFFLIFFVTQ